MSSDASAGPVVRRSRAEEWSALRDLRLRSLKADPQAFGSTLERELEFDEALWKDRALSGSTSATSCQLVAEDARGQLVGCAAIVELQGAVHVFAMWVDPAWRAQGVGRRLLDMGLAWADATFTGRPIVLEVNPTQAAALRLYESRGFRATGVTNPIGHTPGVTVQEMIRHAPPR
jgi:ribosomal protein S18 acetylase RimI-like enzyme